MPRVTVLNASAVVVGDVFTPNLLTPTTFEKFFKTEQPRGITTNVVTQLEYPRSHIVATLEERKFQVVKRSPKQADLARLAELATSFMRQNPLVRLTGVGLNFAGFVRYTPGTGGNKKEDRLINRYVAREELEQLLTGSLEGIALQTSYHVDQTLCRLTLRSDAILNGDEGVSLDLNAHRDLGPKNAVKELGRHLATFPDLWKYFAALGNSVSRNV